MDLEAAHLHGRARTRPGAALVLRWSESADLEEIRDARSAFSNEGSSPTYVQTARRCARRAR
jgi:hypothetical protein